MVSVSQGALTASAAIMPTDSIVNKTNLWGTRNFLKEYVGSLLIRRNDTITITMPTKNGWRTKSESNWKEIIKGRSTKSNGAAKIILPAKTKIIPTKIDSITIKNLIFLEIFRVFALANADKATTKTIKIIIPKKIKFIY